MIYVWLLRFGGCWFGVDLLGCGCLLCCLFGLVGLGLEFCFVFDDLMCLF